MTGLLEFVGEPFDALAWTEPQPTPASKPVPGNMFRELRLSVTAAHASALRAQEALQRRLLAGYRPAEPATKEGAFKPLARTGVDRLDRARLARLAAGEIAAVFGPAYDQDECNPDVRLGSPLVLTGLELGGEGTCDTDDLVAAATQAAQVFALHAGLHLCLPDAEFVVTETGAVQSGPSRGGFRVEVIEMDLVPRPYLRVNVDFQGGGRVHGLTVMVREKPGTPVGPAEGGLPSRWLGRKSASGERALLSEFHLTHLSRGDQGVALGPEFARYTGKRATRLPTGGLLLVDRVISIQGERGKLDGATYETEYDSPADSWYYADTANASMPNCVYMETSLQAALLIGYYLGPTLAGPDETMRLRNLGGTATVLREVDLRDKTIRQSSELLSTTILPGSSLQSFAYTLSADGEPFYQGETLFGYFSDAALANQTGLDAGRSVPSWLDERNPATRTLDLAARRADPAARLCSRGSLALLDEVQVADDGGRYGKGYLHSVRRIDPGDWFFERHFHLDPVIPGSLGVEQVIQAMQEWLLASGLAADLADPEFVVPTGLPFTWKYRGQFLPTDGQSTLEVHLKEIQRAPGRIRVSGDASVWKPGLRIYELTDVAVELRERGAQPW